ncbi:MAG: hypothetical protein ACHRHE_10695 [Tepidisphaerales bacterium]
MGHRIRVLGIRDRQVPLALVRNAVRRVASDMKVDVGNESGRQWQALQLEHSDNTPIAFVECNPVLEGELGAAEVQEFVDEVRSGKPASAAKWLVQYLPKVKVIYAIQVLSGAYVGDGWDAIHAMQNAIWETVGGILQADLEGFSNEDGCHILWQFSDDVKGDWNMAVLNSDGQWTKFNMDLGNREQRRAFLEGRIPPKAKLIH